MIPCPLCGRKGTDAFVKKSDGGRGQLFGVVPAIGYSGRQVAGRLRFGVNRHLRG